MMSKLDTAWARHDAAWRDSAEVVSFWEEAGFVAPESLRFKTRGRFFAVLDELRATLLVTREYEHLVLALSIEDSRPKITYLRLPHPSGLVYDRHRRRLHVAATRNPNQILELAPVDGTRRRGDMGSFAGERRPLVPIASRFYPGCTYLHDLALVGGRLHANAVGENAVVRVEPDGRLTRVWWPRCIERGGRPHFEQNYLQLNSIAAGPGIEDSYFTASTDRMSHRRPGHRNFDVQGRGVVFEGRSRETLASGLTRPHSARVHRRRIWLANSGYGQLGVIEGSRFEPLVRLRGWTRGLCFSKGVAFVGTSRVIPRFRSYAPGVDPETSECAIHAVDVRRGTVLGCLVWPRGNQIFAIDWAPRSHVSGFPFSARRRGHSDQARRLFYAFDFNGASRQ